MSHIAIIAALMAGPFLAPASAYGCDRVVYGAYSYNPCTAEIYSMPGMGLKREESPRPRQHQVYSHRPRQEYVRASCDSGCGAPRQHLVPNATVLGPCPKGFRITPVRGFDYVTPAPGVILHQGQQIHVNLNGTFDLVD